MKKRIKKSRFQHRPFRPGSVWWRRVGSATKRKCSARAQRDGAALMRGPAERLVSYGTRAA